MKEWNIRYRPRQVVILAKQDGTQTRVEIEGLRISRHTDWQPIYDVRELDTRIGYPAAEKSLKPIPVGKAVSR